MSEYLIQGETLTGIADAIRAKTGSSDAITVGEMATAIGSITSGGSSAPVAEKEVNFYDYDGTLLYSYTVEEAQALTELPAGPEHPGLVFQKWNWSLENVKALTRAMNIGALYTTDDGTTRLYIHLEEGRTSPMLGVCPNGTVTVDWGDGTTPDVLTGTSTSAVQWTPNHEYAAPGDYVIRLTVDGEMHFRGYTQYNLASFVLSHSESANNANLAYCNAVRKIEVGSGVTAFEAHAFRCCRSLESISVCDAVATIGEQSFEECYSLKHVVIPSKVTSISKRTFYSCFSLEHFSASCNTVTWGESVFEDDSSLVSACFPDGVRIIPKYMFQDCYSLDRVSVPNNLEKITSYAFYNCYSLPYFVAPQSAVDIGDNSFCNCKSMSFVVLSDDMVNIPYNMFYYCYSLAGLRVPGGVPAINANTFGYCYGFRFCDFSRHAFVPTLSSTKAFDRTAPDLEIRVPAALYDEWIAATNWSTYASRIVAV